MRSTLPWLLLVPFAALSAQQAPEPIPDAATLQREFEAALSAWGKQSSAARAANDEAVQVWLRETRPERQFALKFAAAAKAFAGKEDAVPYLAWIVSRGAAAEAKAAMTTLMDLHVESSGVRLAVARIGGLKQEFGAGQSLLWLDRVLAKNQDPHVRAQALFTRAAMHVGTRATATSEALRSRAVEDLRAAGAILKDLQAENGRGLRGLVESLLDEAQRLEPGLPAPEIDGKDLDGVPFKLSDYRGKVVLLDFWGDW